MSLEIKWRSCHVIHVPNTVYKTVETKSVVGLVNYLGNLTDVCIQDKGRNSMIVSAPFHIYVYIWSRYTVLYLCVLLASHFSLIVVTIFDKYLCIPFRP